jgi:hypothetical protein
MPWALAATAVVGAYGAYSSSQAGKAGAKAQENASNQAIAEQQRQYNQTRADQAPYLSAGQQALGLQQNYLAGDTSGFTNSPDYKFAVQQGTKQLDAGATAQGNLWGGGADADRIALGQGLATQYANNYWNKISGMANNGLQSAQNVGANGANSANQIGAQYNNIGQAQASSYANTANAWNNYGNQLSNLAGQMSQSSYGGSNGGGSNNYGTTGGANVSGNGTGGYGMQMQQPTSSSYNFGYAPSTLKF